ncbi:Protein SCAR3 [Vitis vinifera]|uniref:Protein SCAR n=1 Tax=Vitis vinifera TaxID=29760 RepID=A0A438HH77_VITVI|nr:Protein SCAR3 [Vitis vinifera]
MEISFFMVSKGDGGVEIGSGSARWQCYASGYVIVSWHCHGVEMDDVVMSGIGNTSTVNGRGGGFCGDEVFQIYGGVMMGGSRRGQWFFDQRLQWGLTIPQYLSPKTFTHLKAYGGTQPSLALHTHPGVIFQLWSNIVACLIISSPIWSSYEMVKSLSITRFAAEVFHGLQEQVTTTASRSHKLLVRVQQIEAALPLLEKSILAQRSHIHFAYTAGTALKQSRSFIESSGFAGSNWHASIPNEQNHFIYHDLPRFIMDSYEECRDPPRLHLLDKFDTGGLGSCLKRYSDPTFFRRASVGSDEANAEKAQRDKARKIKKKRSLQRNGELSRSASISNRSGRVQYTSANVRGQTSPSRTVSTVDMALKSDLGDHSNSFDSRTGSGYIECVFHLSSPIQPEEQQPKGSSSGLKMQSHDTFDSASPDGQTKLLENGFPHNSPQKQTGCSSSCVTWDEKTEIVEPKGQESDGDEASEMLPTICNLETQERAPVSIRNVDEMDILLVDDPVSIRNVDEMDILLVDENSPKSISGGNQIDEIESETDNYMDALNTIDSESENDFDCQTKREVEQYSSHFNNEGTEDRDNKTLGSEHHPSDLESCTASHSSSNQGMSLNSPNSVPSVCLVHEQPTLIAGKSPLLRAHQSLRQGPTDDKVRSSFCESQESSADVSSVHSVKFWTNGGLLGLEPSKPPDFSVSNAVVENSVCIEKDLASKCSTSRPGDQEDGVSIKRKSWGFSSAGLDTKPEKLSDSHQSARFGHAHEQGLNVAGPVTPRTELPVVPDETGSIETNKENNENSSRGFGLGHTLLINGFRRNVSLVQDEKSEPASSAKSSAFEETSGHQSVSYQTYPETDFKKQFGRESPINSLSSSPPLEQMKISFHPINGFETSKLKLKFPDGSHCNESIRDMFPSFQLVPDPATPLHDIDFDSDDDTFCRSSPCMSDDCLSHHSESNSEQWECGETLINKDHELYDALCRISSTESVSSSQELEGVAHGTIRADSGHLQMVWNLLSLESMPPPPPLPPLQWRALKPDSDMAEEKQYVISEALDHLFDLKLLESTDSQHSEPVLARQQQNVEANACKPKSNVIEKQDRQKSNGQKEVNEAANGKKMDEREDFLEQIRTKSFSLRRTATPRLTVMPTPATNVSVTAILEKANAIRQAVGSDDGEDDDNWSDT